MAQNKRGRQARSGETKALSELKRKGLYSGDIKRGRVTDYQRSVLKKFQDVTNKQATVLNVGTKAARSFRAEGARGARSKIVVETAPKEQVRYNKRKGTITGKRRVYGTTVVRTVHYQHVFDPAKLPKPPKGVSYRYRVRFGANKRDGSGGRPTAWMHDLSELAALMNLYQAAQTGSKKNRDKFRAYWTNSVEVEEVEYGSGIYGDDEDEAED